MPKFEGDIREVRGKIYRIAGIPTRSIEVDFDADAAENYVNVSGDIMTGFLSLHEDPLYSNHAVTKNYVDVALSGATVPGNFLAISGGTLTGYLTLHADPTLDYQAATKHYVDERTTTLSGHVDSVISGADGYFVSSSGDTMTGTLDIISGSISIKTHEGFPGTEYREETAGLQTDDNSFVAMNSFKVEEGEAYWFESTVIGKKITPSTPTKLLLEINRGCVYRDVGSGAAITTVIDNALTRSVGAITYDVKIVTSGNKLITTVNGDGAETVNWTGTLKYQKVG